MDTLNGTVNSIFPTQTLDPRRALPQLPLVT